MVHSKYSTYSKVQNHREHLGKHKMQKGPQFGNIILQGCSSYDNSNVRVVALKALIQFGSRSFNSLSFVHNHRLESQIKNRFTHFSRGTKINDNGTYLEINFAEKLGVAYRNFIRGDDNR